jgi:hypothetical protein
MPSFTLVSFQVTTISILLNFFEKSWFLMIVNSFTIFELTCFTRLKQFHTKTLFLTHLSLEPRVFHNAIVTQNNAWETLIRWNSTINRRNSEGNKKATRVQQLMLNMEKGYVNFVLCFCFVLFFCRLCSTMLIVDSVSGCFWFVFCWISMSC